MSIFTVAAEDIMGENYKVTSIECSDYNPNIDNSITVTITVTDVYEDPIEGENVTVTATGGTFTQLNGSDITSASSVTGTTNSSGQFTLTYSCTEWGLITFTANNKTTQIRVVGCKGTTVNQYYTIYEYEDKVGFKINITVNVAFNTTWTNIYNNAIPWNLRPKSAVTCQNYNSASSNTAIGVRAATNEEKVEIITKSLEGSSVSTTAYAYLEWSKV